MRVGRKRIRLISAANLMEESRRRMCGEINGGETKEDKKSE